MYRGSLNKFPGMIPLRLLSYSCARPPGMLGMRIDTVGRDRANILQFVEMCIRGSIVQDVF